MTKPSQNITKTWINLIIATKYPNSGNFTFYYKQNDIDTVWDMCVNMPDDIKKSLYKIKVSTVLNPITKLKGHYQITFYCNANICEQVITIISHYLNYSNELGYCMFYIDNTNKSNKIKIKKIKKSLNSDCFDE